MEDEEHCSALQDVMSVYQISCALEWVRKRRSQTYTWFKTQWCGWMFLFCLQSKPPPPPPTGFPKVPQTVPPGPGGPPSAPVNMFSRRAGNRQHWCLKYRLQIFSCIKLEGRGLGFSGVVWKQLATQWYHGAVACCWLSLCLASALWLLSQMYCDLGVIVSIPRASFSDSERWLNQQTVQNRPGDD